MTTTLIIATAPLLHYSTASASAFTDIATTSFYINISTASLPLVPVSYDHPYVLFARERYLWMVPLFVFILAISIIGIGVIVMSVYWIERLTNHNRLCLSLAAADVWAGSLLISGLIVNSYMPVVLSLNGKNNKCVEAALEIFRISGMLTSNLHILALSINQFIGICRPLKYKMLITTRRVRIIIFMLWIIPLLFVGSWFVATPGDGFRNPSCSHRFYSRFPFRLSIFTSFIIPLCLTYALYSCILLTLWKAKAKYDNLVEELRMSLTTNSYRQRVRSKMKLVWTTLLILSTFTLSWGLCVLYFVLVCIDGCPFIYLKTVPFQVGLNLSSAVNFLVTLKLLFNPLIYALRMQHIRHAVALMLTSFVLKPLCGITLVSSGTRPDRPLSQQQQRQLFRTIPECPSRTRRKSLSVPNINSQPLIKEEVVVVVVQKSEVMEVSTSARPLVQLRSRSDSFNYGGGGGGVNNLNARIKLKILPAQTEVIRPMDHDEIMRRRSCPTTTRLLPTKHNSAIFYGGSDEDDEYSDYYE